MIPITQLTGRLGNLMFDFAFLVAFARDHHVYDGYFPQDIEWFRDYEEDIKKLYREGMNMTPRAEVALHIRRGDYLEPDKPQYVLPMTYYLGAMGMFPASQQFLIFSDDRQWCKEAFPNHTVYCGADEIDDFNEMARCSSLIIANSTFSWWAAYIAPFAKRVIMPLKWETGKWAGRVMTAPSHWERI